MRMHLFQNVFFCVSTFELQYNSYNYTAYILYCLSISYFRSPKQETMQKVSGPKIRKKLSKLVLFNHSMKNMDTFTIPKFPVFRTKFSLNLYIYIYIYIYI